MIRGWLGAALLAAAAPAQVTAPRHVILVDVDGIRRDTFAQAWRGGLLPNFQRLFAGAVWFDQAYSVVPTVTMAGQAAIFTGAPPARSGIPGNSWFDRDSGRMIQYLSPSGLACIFGWAGAGAECAGGWANRHLLAPTIYEAATAAGLTSIAVYTLYWRGATVPALPSLAEALAFAGAGFDYVGFDTHMTDRAIAEARQHGVPALLAVYFAGADAVAHARGIAAQFAYFQDVIDPLLGRLLDALEDVEPGWRERSMAVLASDHGRTDAVPYPGDPSLEAELRAAFDAEIATNGGVAYVYLRDGGAVPSRPARTGDLTVVLERDHYFDNTGVGSHHGSVYREDLVVPLLVAAPELTPHRVLEPVGITRIAATIAAYLGFGMDSADPPLPLSPPLDQAPRRKAALQGRAGPPGPAFAPCPANPTPGYLPPAPRDPPRDAPARRPTPGSPRPGSPRAGDRCPAGES